MPYFRFMTGAGFYRIEAASREQAIQFIIEELQPTENAKAVILQTLYNEEDRHYAMVDPAETVDEEDGSPATISSEN